MSNHHYKGLTIDEIQNVNSQFLIDSWSYSKVTSFARNEKAFEMSYIFGIYSKSSATTIAGQAYHHALQYYFTQKKEGKQVQLVDLEQSAFEYIDQQPGNFWKLQKTTPTVEECQKKACKTVADLLRNFIGEISVYESEMAEILSVEIYIDEYVTINGVDIPLPCHLKIDLVFRTKDGKVVIADHKSKGTFTPDDEIALSIGVQAITYVKGYEANTGQTVDEVWFIENKYSKNKDNSPQLSAFKVSLDENTRRLYEALLYEPLKRMLEAVNDPDHVYMINDSDNFVDKAELYDFWARTMICDVEDFNVEESKKELVQNRLRKIRDSSVQMINPKVIKNFRENAASFIQYDLSKTDMTQAEKIEHVMRSFGKVVRVAHTFDGYSSNTYLLEVSAGEKITSFFSHHLDIANALDVADVRILNQMQVYEGRSFLSIEVGKKREKDLFFDPALLEGRRIPLGRDNMGNLIVWDLDNHSTPHMLVCGSTGSGKSVMINSVIEYCKLAEIPNILIFDPKYEFLHHDASGATVVNDIEQIEEYMAKTVEVMQDYVKRNKKEHTLIVFDEFADAVANARKGAELKIYENVLDGFYANGSEKRKRVEVGEHKSLEQNMKIILQKGRSAGFRVLAATQRASTNVITGDAKANYPVQVCFRVPKTVDSMVVLDEPGGETLMGRGDGLIKSPEYLNTVRFQAFYKK